MAERPPSAAASTFFVDNFGTAKHIVIAGLYIHDVNGSNGNGDNAKDNGGIIFRTNGDKAPSRFDGLTIERNIVWKVDRSAIAAQSSTAAHALVSKPYVVIRDNFVDDIGGDGIVPWATDGVLSNTTSRSIATAAPAAITPGSGPGAPTIRSSS